MQDGNRKSSVAVIGGGPAGLMAAEVLSAGGAAVTVYDRMPSLARKFLLAGRGGLNLTHSENLGPFLTRYGDALDPLRPAIEALPPEALRGWCEALGQETFVGSSGRVFPKSMKASPLLRAWLRRLDAAGVQVKLRHRWTGWDDSGRLTFETPDGAVAVAAPATVLALGGASWPRLGSDGSWVAPLKRIALAFDGVTVRGEATVTATGLEGGGVYALSAPLRRAIADRGEAILLIDLRPDVSAQGLEKRLARPRGKQSLSTFLRKAVQLSPVAIALLQETAMSASTPLNAMSAGDLAAAIKAAPVRLTGVAPIDKAISTAGGVTWGAVDADLMLRDRLGTFVAGEMLDWEAPTGGYLLQAVFATGARAGRGVLRWLRAQTADINGS